MELINSITPYQWYLIGAGIVSIAGTIGLTAWIARRHLRIKGEKLWSGFIVLNVFFWGHLLVLADALSTNLGQITHIGTLLPQIAPFISTWGPRVSMIALLTHIIASAVYKWWIDRKNKKPITNPNLPDLTAQVQAVTSQSTVSGQKSSSMGSTSAGQTIQL